MLKVRQLFSGQTQLINALELVEWNSDDTQFLVCEACGFTDCKPGDWVSVRKSGSLVLILPASGYVWNKRMDKDEYSPPSYLMKQGIAYLDFSTYEELRLKHSSFPALDQINPLKLKEAMLLFQWNAPYRLLGEPPTISVRRDLIVGSSEGDHLECLQQIEGLVRAQYKDEGIAQLRPLSENETVISLYLDTSEFIEWDALVFDESEYRLLVDSSFVIAPAAA